MMVVIGVLTYLTRLSFIALLDRWPLSERLQRALRFVPVAALSAIIAPALVFSDRSLALGVDNPRLIGGVAAALVAFVTRNVLLTIAAGMAVYLLAGRI